MKKWFGIAGIIIATGIILYIMFIPRVYQKEVVINAPLLRLYKQISVIGNYAKWYSTFSGTDTAGIRISGKDRISDTNTDLQIVTLNERSCLLQVKENNSAGEVLFSIRADTVNKNTVTVLYKTTTWKKITGSDPVVQDAEKSLAALKAYTEDTKKVYGYPITLTEVTDTTFLFTSKVVSKKEKQQSIKDLYKFLTGYAAAKDAGYTGTNIFYISEQGKDSVRLYQSIGVSKNTMILPIYGTVSVKRMPYKKNLVVAAYDGKFGDIPNVFAALEQFSTDNSMISMAIPFLKFAPGENDFDDEKIISAKAYFPVR